MGILKRGSRGESVKILQRFLGLVDDGEFGRKTEFAVKEFQKSVGLKPDGIVGAKTWEYFASDLVSTDASETSYKTNSGLWIKPNYLDPDEYQNKITKKEYLFLHHTAGWNNPYDTIHGWNTDNRGTIGTEFVIGGQNIKTGDDKYDGEVLQAFPEGYYAWHLGKNGKPVMHSGSVGIEICNFGQLKDGKAWQGTKAKKNQIVKLDKAFRGYSEFHRYSDDQIKNLKKLILHIANRDNIDVKKGLPALIKKKGVEAFEFQSDAYYGRIKGLWTHTNTRKDKFDCFPQPELIDMLLSL